MMPRSSSFCSVEYPESGCPFLTLADNLPDVITRYDLELRFIYANSAIEHAIGLPPEEILGKTNGEIGADPALASKWDQHLKEAFKTAKCSTTGFSCPSPRGTLHFESIIVPEKTPDGSVKSLFVYNRNITRRKREPSEATHWQVIDIIEYLPDATFVIDNKKKVIAWNKAIEEMTGVTKKEILGKNKYLYAVPFYGIPRPILIDLVSTDTNGHAKAYDVLEWKGGTVRAETSAPKLHGGKGAYLSGTASPIFDAKGNKIGAIEAIRDITHHKNLESSLRKREKELEENTQKLQETNTALKVLLRQREGDQKDLEEGILTSVKGRVLPYLDNLKRSRLDEAQKLNLEVLEAHLEEIISPFYKNISLKYFNLTPMEIRIADLIKTGKTSKEIALLLGVAEKTVLAHRYNLRTKLNITNEKINLRSHLTSLS